MRRIALLLLLSSATLAFLQAQQPVITSLQSAPTPSGPLFGAAITSATPIQSMTLYINGTFDPQLFNLVHWANTVTGASADFTDESVLSVTATQIVVTVPSVFTVSSSSTVSLFATPVSSPQIVNITVNEFLQEVSGTTNSNAAPYTLNPPLAPPSSTMLPAGSTGQFYSAPLFSGGTPPYTVTIAQTPSAGSFPPGLSPQNPPTLSGIPTQAGLFPFTLQITDEWSNQLTPAESVQIVSAATLTAITPNAAPAGSNAIPITVTGTNFVNPGTQILASAVGSTVLTPLTTVVVNATTATAVIPASLLTAPQQLGIVAMQPGGFQSGSLPFSVLPPVITTVSPGSITAQSTPVALKVAGANFLSAGSAAPAQSTILVNGSPVSTTFGNSTSLSANVAFTTPGAVSVQVENPAGSMSNIATVNVLAAPAITSVTPNPFPGGKLTVNGVNFTSTMAVLFNGTPIATSFVNNVQLTAVVPASLDVGTSALLSVETTDNYVTPSFKINLTSSLQITTTSLPATYAQQPYDAKLAATGGTLPYVWSATGLPQALSINPATGEITGTINTAGNVTVTVSVTDATSLTASMPFTITVLATPAITSVTPNPFPGGTLTVNGVNFASGMTILFNGVAISTVFVSTGQLTGTVPASLYVGTTALVSVNAGLGYITPAVKINLTSALQITTTSLPTTYTQQPYDAKLAATGGTPPYVWSATGLPQTLSINPATGEITGTINTAGNLTVTVTVTDATSLTARMPFTITVLAAPAITSVTPNPFPGGTLTVNGVNFASGMTILFNGVAIPTVFVSTGQLTGTVPASLYVGTTALVSVNAGLGYITPAVKINLTSALQITTTSLPTANALQPYDAKLAATGGTPPYVWSASGLPQTLSINPATGEITGTINTAANVSLTVTVTDANSQTASMAFTITVLAAPAITSVTPNPFPGGTLTVNGVNFASGMKILFNGVAIPTGFVSAGQLTGTVPASLYVGATAQVAVTTSLGYVTPSVKINLNSSLQIITTSIPAPIALQPYDAKLAATGGVPPYTWKAVGLPLGLNINASTGEITGTTSSVGGFTVTVTVMDSLGQTAASGYSQATTAPAQAPQINTAAPPTGFVSVSYSFSFTASGGNGTVSFGLGSGSVPPGLVLDNTGLLKGTPTTAGTYAFSVIANDSVGLTSSASFTVTIKPQPLNIITSSPLASVNVGAPVNVTFTAFGGVPPYTFGSTGNLPPGTSISSSGTLSGTTTTAGTFAFTVTVNDSAQSTPGTKGFSITVNPAALTVTASLGNGPVGAAYTGTISATGGVPPYSFTVTGLPDGLSFASGTVSGTPTTAGSSTVTVTVTDSAKTTASQTFPITISAPSLAVSTTSLPNGTVSVAYSASLAATGGSGKYSWSVTGLPTGLSATSAGVISGTPTAAGAFTVSATVTDAAVTTTVVSASQTLSLTIVAAPLSITTSSLANATAGTAYSATLAATGGVPPYTFSATGLPSGLSISSAGAISGTVTAAGNASVAVTVKDSTGTTASRTLPLTVVLPPAPALNLTGLPPTTTPATQSTLTLGLGTAFPVAVTVNLTLTFTAASGPDDPTVQFSTGGRTAQFTIPAGSTATTTVGVQTGTVAGTATVTAQLLAGTVDITPAPAPTSTVRIPSVAPVITSLTATATSTGFTVTAIGFATSRAMTQAVFTFTPASGVNLQTTSVTISAASLFATWYSSTAALPFGSQFNFTQPFTVTGGTSAVSSVSLTLTNGDGTSTAVSAAVH